MGKSLRFHFIFKITTLKVKKVLMVKYYTNFINEFLRSHGRRLPFLMIDGNTKDDIESSALLKMFMLNYSFCLFLVVVVVVVNWTHRVTET